MFQIVISGIRGSWRGAGQLNLSRETEFSGVKEKGKWTKGDRDVLFSLRSCDGHKQDWQPYRLMPYLPAVTATRSIILT